MPVNTCCITGRCYLCYPLHHIAPCPGGPGCQCASNFIIYKFHEAQARRCLKIGSNMCESRVRLYLMEGYMWYDPAHFSEQHTYDPCVHICSMCTPSTKLYVPYVFPLDMFNVLSIHRTCCSNHSHSYTSMHILVVPIHIHPSIHILPKHGILWALLSWWSLCKRILRRAHAILDGIWDARWTGLGI